MKRIISVILTIAMVLGISMETFAAYGGEKAHAYQSDNYTITYIITNEWSGNQQISVSITNDGEETLRNWAVMFDNVGEITNIWNAEVFRNDGELCVIRNNGYNYEIIPNATVEFGFMLQGEDLSLPEDIYLCSRTADSTQSAEITYEIQNNWGDGFIAAVTINNISDEPLEAWRLSFNGNFEISTIWNANQLYSEDGCFKVENDITTTPIAAGGEKTFSFQGAIASGETPVMSDFQLTSVIIDTERTQPDPPSETDEAPSGETTEPATEEITTEESPELTTEETTETGESGETAETEESSEPEEPTILCFGGYLAEENSLEVYWYSTAEGAVSVHQNTDNGGWNKLAEVTDSDSYKYEITEDFLVRYIKVSQETDNGTIESEPFVVAYTDDGYVCTWLDSDDDGLPDYSEKIYGTDPNSADTDGDGLSDYDEIYKTGTSPLKYDTDEDGVNDADRDNDKDGLTNSEELALGTDSNSADTDGDGLSDYDEINKHNTDPLKADSDEDTLNDGDEIALGLDPNDPETFGVPDAEYKVKQTISADSEVMERVNTEDSPFELSLEITASGNAQNLIAGSSAYSAITESDARLGGAVSLSYYSGDVEKVKLTYEIGENYISNEGSEYAENCVDLQGIKRYNIFRYFEELNMLLPVATEFDEDNHTLFAETDELGTYCVLDMEVLLQTFGVNPDGTQTESVEMQMYSAPADYDEYCVTFVFDIRKGRINDGQLNNLKAEVRDFAETVFAEGRNVSIRIMTQDSSDFDGESSDLIDECDDLVSLNKAMSLVKVSKYEGDLGNYCVITDAIAETVNSADASVNNYVFTLFDQTDSVFEQNIAEELGNKAKEDGINISVITPSFEELVGFQKTICDVTGGIMIDTFGDFADDVYEHIFDETYEPKELPPEPQKEFDAILITGYERITLDSILYPNGENPTGKDTDTDKDGLTDWDEVDVERWEKYGLISREDNGYINLPTLKQCMEYTDKPYVEEGLGRFISQPTISLMLNDIRVMPITSDPTREDSDGDEVFDIYDKNPLAPIDVFSACLNSDYGYELEGVENHDMVMDFANSGRNYICSNCGYTVISPEYQDYDLLTKNDYVTTRMLMSLYNSFYIANNIEVAELLYSCIDKIRFYNSKGQYYYSDSNGQYVSPCKKLFVSNENDFFVEVKICDYTASNLGVKVVDSIIQNGIYMVKDIGDIASVFISPGIGTAWACLSESLISVLEHRQSNFTEMGISALLAYVDDFDGVPVLSAVNTVRSVLSHIGIYICQYEELKQSFEGIARDYTGMVVIQNGIDKLTYVLNLNGIIVDLNLNIPITDYNMFIESASKNMPYKNTISYSDYTSYENDYSFLWAIIGNEYYWRDWRDFIDGITDWTPISEYPGGRFT